MNISFYGAKSSMIAQQQGLNIYANNIANVNTVGFKGLRPSFADCIYTIRQQNRPEWETGHGQYLMKTDLVWSEGNFTATEQPLDFALAGPDFFMVRDRNGNTFLTRDGSFNMSANEDGTWQLVNGSGDFVLGYDGEPITIPFMSEEVDGVQNVTSEPDYLAVEQMVGVFSVPNNWGLEQTNNNRLVVTERSGPPIANPDAEKISGALEMSNVDLASEMVHIIETQRSYQLNAKIIQTSDEFINTANNLRS
ncbi:MAG: flagellar hook-basal body protein [Oscillospiraceae bacterium]|nr:flagellar hook-basal body protein [Oscillospiraceae bacterium]